MTGFPDLVPRLAERMPRLRGRLLANQPMAPLTWFRVGGPAQVLFTPADEDDLAYFLGHRPEDVPVTVVGVGSNLIVRDGGVPGVVVRLSPKGFGAVEAVGDGHISAGAAALDRKVAEVALEHGIGGFAFYHGIPGSIGGALTMNAGASGRETGDVVVYANGVTPEGELVSLSQAEMGFVYRGNRAPEGVIFTSALLRGVPEDRASIRAAMDAVQHHRETVQPIREKTGGSTFKNPVAPDGTPLSAWKLIDAAGLRGHRRGGAQVSTLHCNFLLNVDGATAADIEGLGEEIRARVEAASGIVLQWEIRRIGIPG